MMTPQPARRARRGAFAIATLALGATLAACSPSTGSSGSASPTGMAPTTSVAGGAVQNSSLPDPCHMLTNRQIKAAAGVDLQPGKENAQLSNADQRVCDWLPASGASPYVEILVTAATADTVATQRASAESAMGTATDVNVIGGENAYTVANGSIIGMGVADYFIQVTYFTGDTTDVSSITQLLAKAVTETV
jgi:hypothetical protein